MTSNELLKNWEHYSGLRLIGGERDAFLRDAELILYLDDDILEMALKVAAQKRNFDLQYIETVGLHLRQYLRRLNYESIEGDAAAPAPSARTKKHLTLIQGSPNTR